MKKQITLLSVVILVFAAITITALAQKEKDNKGKGNKEQGNQGKGKEDKGNQGNKDNKNNDNSDKGNKDKDKGRDDKGNKDDENGKDKNKDKDEVKNKMKDGFKWDRETFRDRDDIRKSMDKVSICHKPGKDGDPGVSIRVSANALKAHLNHGDVEGECPNVTNAKFSDGFLRRRTDYFNVLQNSQEQVLYSRSILDYAVERLTGAKSQLVVLERNNAPAADLERKRLLIVDLENNVSLLQTLVGVTANLVADRLMN